MSKRKNLFLLWVLLIPILLLLVCTLIYWYVPKSTLYYIPQKKVYIKITETAKPHLDIVLGYSSKMSKSKEYDSFKFYKHLVRGFIIDPKENILYFNYEIIQSYDDEGREFMDTIIPNYHLNSVKFKMIEKILFGDTLFYDKQEKTGDHKLKKKYIDVVIQDRNHVLLKASEDSVYKYIIPLLSD